MIKEFNAACDLLTLVAGCSLASLMVASELLVPELSSLFS